MRKVGGNENTGTHGGVCGTQRKHSSPRPNRQQARRDEGCPDQAQGVTSLIAMFGGGNEDWLLDKKIK